MKYFKFIIILSLVVSSVNLHGYFFANEIENAFTPKPCEGCKNYDTLFLKQLIIDGAGFFIQSNSQYQLFLKEVEFSGIYGINQEAIKNALDNAVKNMELANDTYNKLVPAANQFEYNPPVLEALYHFDYPGYRDLNQLNPTIFQQVEQLLKSGDVRGCLQWFYNATNEIQERLKIIKSCADICIMPEIPECWRLNQLYMETQIFGQYTAEIFMNLKY